MIHEFRTKLQLRTLILIAQYGCPQISKHYTLQLVYGILFHKVSMRESM